MDLRTISLCSGGAGLELGIRLAGRVCGFSSRVICYVEREAYAQAILVARIKEGLLDDAPIWSDLKTFDPHPWRGKVDLLTGGLPCQPASVAGKGLGRLDHRWLWGDMCKIVEAIKPSVLFLENVDGLINRGYREVRQDLEDLGYRITEGIFSAEEVGATHLRKRLFILAVATDSRGRSLRLSRDSRLPRSDGEGQEDSGPGERGEALAYSAVITEREPRNGQCSDSREDAWLDSCRGGYGVFPTGPDDHDAWLRLLSERATAAPALPMLGARGLKEVLAAEPDLRLLVDGLAPVLDEAHAMRSEQLSALGNGVVPHCAAVSFCVLAKRAGIL